MIVNRQRKVRIARKELNLFLERIRRELRLEHAEISVALVSDAEMSRLNKAYRNKIGPTDVLSFPSRRSFSCSGNSPLATRLPAGQAGHSFTLRKRSAVEGPLLLGDIAIAPATARRYARRNGRTLANELRVLLLHGVLHLLGYDHEKDQGQMNRVERKLRRRLGLA